MPRGSRAIRVPLPKFIGKKGEDPDTHEAYFVLVCQANGFLKEDDQKNLFPCTLKGIAMDWYVHFESNYFASRDIMKTRFLD